jgi:hypothetical protein
MLNVATISVGLDTGHPLRDPRSLPVPARGRTIADAGARAHLLADYLEGWAEADPVKIADATAPEYRLDDPFVGAFSTRSLPRYFAALRSRAGIGGLVGREHLAFVLRGPMDTASARGELQFWREAPRLGLTGTSLITIGPAGVTSERVSYDLNMASEQLRQLS